MKITLTAISHEGLGGVDFYTETISIPTQSNIESYIRVFALKYGVGLDDVECHPAG